MTSLHLQHRVRFPGSWRFVCEPAAACVFGAGGLGPSRGRAAPCARQQGVARGVQGATYPVRHGCFAGVAEPIGSASPALEPSGTVRLNQCTAEHGGSLSPVTFFTVESVARTPNYNYEKSRKERERKARKEAKAKRKSELAEAGREGAGEVAEAPVDGERPGSGG